jgi:hypothetical protein
MIRQGDVLLVPTDEPSEKKLVQRDKIVLALGEATGHAHVIEQEGAALFETPTGERVVWVVAPTTILHQEHSFGDTEVVTRGWYVVTGQVQEDPLAGIRRVTD